MSTLVAAVAALAIGTMIGCESDAPVEQTAIGAGVGAAGGALIGEAASDSLGTGAVIGAGVGAGGGYLYGEGQDE